ncbi:hypothetical protein K402DRAFT_306251, partial [Aulographum hederae CBS 113979]
MQIEETPHRIYIHDLDAELSCDSEPESTPLRPIFLPDIEKHITRLPPYLLSGNEPSNAAHREMVLYQVPSSLSVPEERDSVRKAILEARARVR